MLSIYLYIVHFICFLLEWSCTQAEMFCTITDCEIFLKMQIKTIDDLENFVRKEAKRMSVLKQRLEILKREHRTAMEDFQNYLKNPINIFLFIKRLTTDADDIREIISNGTAGNKTRFGKLEKLRILTNEDLEEAAISLSRIQTIYKLDVKELAEGILDGDQNHSSPMTAGDCFEMGRILYDKENYENTIPWMMEALRKYREDEDNAYSFNEIDIFEFISTTHYYLDDVKSAAIWSEKILELEPTNSHALKNLQLYRKLIDQNNFSMGENEPLSQEKKAEELNDEFENYSSICRGDKKILQEVAKSLACYYVSDKHPFLRLARIKVEQLYADPEVLLFYDVIRDKESAIIQNMAKQRLHRSLIQEARPVESRISKQAWLRDEDSAVIAGISRRVSHFTGYSVATAEPLQVAYYDVGGHYEPHYDSLDIRNSTVGNRLATVLFYISEVAQGGATVFPKLGLRVFPVKNAALFWVNLNPTGERDHSTLHAACPVIRGNKWIATKWIREFGQELIKPCSKRLVT